VEASLILVGVGLSRSVKQWRGGARSTIKDSQYHKSYSQSVDAVMNFVMSEVPLPAKSGGCKGIIAQCVGKLCVNPEFKVPPSYPELARCGASGVTERLYSGAVPQGFTIWVLIGNKPCEPYETPYPSSGNSGSDQSARRPRQQQVLASTTSRQARDRSALDTALPEGDCSPQRPATGRLAHRTPQDARPVVALTWVMRA
jgi:hypothetical protein